MGGRRLGIAARYIRLEFLGLPLFSPMGPRSSHLHLPSLSLLSIKWGGYSQGRGENSGRHLSRACHARGAPRKRVQVGGDFHVLGFSARLMLGAPECRPRATAERGRLSASLAGLRRSHRFRTLPPPAGFWRQPAGRRPGFIYTKAAGGSWPCMDERNVGEPGTSPGEAVKSGSPDRYL